MMRIWIILPFLAACNGTSGACLTYGEQEGDSGIFGDFACLDGDSKSCNEDDGQEFHSEKTCEDLGYTEDCGWGGESRYTTEYCEQFSS